MNESPFDDRELAASVMAVPPLARRADLALDADQNATLIRHIEAGGVRTLLYGGNAN
ncbi:MAG: dihydrodipicolinate synthase family protein, partial [Paraburkholderia caledonica]